MKKSNSDKKSKRKSKTFIAIIIFTGIFAILLLIPSIIPSSTLSKIISSIISLYTNCDASVRETHFSWSGGLNISDIELKNEKKHFKMTIKKTSICSNPLLIIAEHGIPFISVEGVLINTYVGKNLLSVNQEDGKKISLFPLPVKRISISSVHSNIRWDKRNCTKLNIPQIEIVYGEDIRWYLHGKFKYKDKDAGKFTMKGKLTENRTSGTLSGTVYVKWNNVDLKALPRKLLVNQNRKLCEIEGTSSGNFSLEIQPEVKFRWSVQATFKDITTQSAQLGKGNMQILTVQSVGLYDPLGNNIKVDKFTVKSKYTSLQGKFDLIFTGPDVLKSNLALHGKLNTRLLGPFLPEVGGMEGVCEFDLKFTFKDKAYFLVCSIDADEISLINDDIKKVKGEKCRVEFALKALPETWPWMQIEDIKVTLKDLNLAGKAILPRVYMDDDFNSWIDRTRRLSVIELKGKIDNVESFVSLFPKIQGEIDPFKLTGPAFISTKYTGQDKISRISITTELMKNSTLVLDFKGIQPAPLWIKPKSEKLKIETSAYWRWNSNISRRIDFTFKIECGKFSLASDKLSQISLADTKGNSTITLLNLSGEIKNIEQLIQCSPYLNNVGLKGKVFGDLRFSLEGKVKYDSQTAYHLTPLHLTTSVNGRNLRLVFPEFFSKPKDIPLNAKIDYEYRSNDNLGKQISFAVSLLGSEGTLQVSHNPQETKGKLAIKFRETNTLLPHFPIIRKIIGNETKLSGNAIAFLDFRYQKDKETTLQYKFDGNELGLVIGSKGIKLPGIPAEVTGKCVFSAENGMINLAPTRVVLGSSNLNIEKADIVIDKQYFQRMVHNKVSVNSQLRVLRPLFWAVDSFVIVDFKKMDSQLRVLRPLFKDAKAFARGHLEIEEELNILKKDIDKIFRKYDLAGGVDFNVRIDHRKDIWEIGLNVNADKLVFNVGDFINKTRKTIGKGEVNLRMYCPENNKAYVEIRKADFKLGAFTFDGDGEINLELNKDGFQPKRYFFSFTIPPINLADLARSSNILLDLRTEGVVSANLLIRNNGNSHPSFTGSLRCASIKASVDNIPLLLDGELLFSDTAIHTDSFKVLLDDSIISVHIDTLFDHKPIGFIEIKSDNINADKFIKFSEIIRKEFWGKAEPVNQTDYITKLADLLKNTNLLLNIHSHQFTVTDFRDNIRHNVKELVCNVKTEAENMEMEFWGKLSGGTIKGLAKINLTKDPPKVTMESALENLKMSPRLQPMIDNFFPGLFVTGRISIYETSSFDLKPATETSPNYPEGKGKMIFINGYMIGKSAPDWVTNIFPRLNFAKYTFYRMHNWFRKYKDGKVHNNMIFRGNPWNIYIEGDSFPDGRVKYEVGVDLLARFESEYWSSVGQGRVPIFTTEGLIRNGKFAKQKISYVPPHELIYRVFIKNNLITGAYRILTRSILAEPKNKKSK